MYIELHDSFSFWSAQSLRWNEWGGPQQAVLHGRLPVDLNEAPALLGKPICVYARQGRPAWWGYVDEVQARLAKVTVRWRLEDMANRCAPLQRVQDAPPFGRPWQPGPWQEDRLSQARFGVRERLLHSGEAAPPTWPPGQYRPQQRGTATGLCLIGRGWLETLTWRTAVELETRPECTQPGGVLQTLDWPLAQELLLLEEQHPAAIWLRAAQTGATGPLLAQLCQDSSGQPGNPLASAELLPTQVSSAATWQRLPLPPSQALPCGSRAWLCLSGSPAWRVEVNEAAPVSAGSLWRADGSGWAKRLPEAALLFSLESQWDARRLLEKIGSLAGQFLSGWQAELNPLLTFQPPSAVLTYADLLKEVCALANAQALVTPERILRLRPHSACAERSLGPDGRVYDANGQLLSLDSGLAGHPLRLSQSQLPAMRCTAAHWQPGKPTAEPVFTKL